MVTKPVRNQNKIQMQVSLILISVVFQAHHIALQYSISTNPPKLLQGNTDRIKV